MKVLSIPFALVSRTWSEVERMITPRNTLSCGLVDSGARGLEVVAAGGMVFTYTNICLPFFGCHRNPIPASVLPTNAVEIYNLGVGKWRIGGMIELILAYQRNN